MSNLTAQQIREETQKVENEIAAFVHLKMLDLQDKLNIRNHGQVTLSINTGQMQELKYRYPKLICESVSINVIL